MKEQLISFKTAKLAKKKGFDIKVETFYMGDSEDNFLHNAGKKDNWNNYKCILNESELSDDYSAPTQSLLQKWLREVHLISIKVDDFTYNSKIRYDVNVVPLGSQEDTPSEVLKSYEEALEKGLQEALKLIK